MGKKIVIRDRDSRDIKKQVFGVSVFSLSQISNLKSRCAKAQHGFTLIELLTVVAIIGILTTVVSVNLNSARAQARDARREADVGAIQSAIELYMNANGGAVLATTGEIHSNDSANWSSAASGHGKLIDPGGYLSSIPLDPTNSATLFYSYSGTGTTYYVDTKLEARASGANATVSSSTLGWPYVTGMWADGSNMHYRVSSGAN